jgi:hypothetical protein
MIVRRRAFVAVVPVVLLLFTVPLLASHAGADKMPGFEQEFQLGTSAGGRPITGHRFGAGNAKIALIGGIHGGQESNTTLLVETAVAYFRDQPDQIAPGVELDLIPCVNPDGCSSGRRTNDHGVDLNRNWDNNWSPIAYWGKEPVDPGPFAFSEPETRSLRDFLTGVGFGAVVFYHSSAARIFVGTCGEPPDATIQMVERLSHATGYLYWTDGFGGYSVTGASSDYLACRNIPAFDIELSNPTDIEWERNLAGIMTLLQMLNPA